MDNTHSLAGQLLVAMPGMTDPKQKRYRGPQDAIPAREEPSTAASGGADDTVGGLSHVASGGGVEGPHSRMVDVGAKAASARRAVAEARLRFPAGALEPLLRDGGPKGPVLEVARVAGIQGVKRTSDWIPMCHPLAVEAAEIHFADLGDDVLGIRCEVSCSGKTGVEMEALCGATAAALTVYDMTKAVHRGTVIERVRLCEKEGGRSGLWRAGDG